MIAANVRSRRVQPSGAWHLDEVFARMACKRMYLWRAADDEGEALEVLVQSRPNKRAGLKLMRKLLKKQGYIPDDIVTDKLSSYSAALRELDLAHLHVTGGRWNSRAEVSYQPTRRSADENAEWAGSSRQDRCSLFGSSGLMWQCLHNGECSHS